MSASERFAIKARDIVELVADKHGVTVDDIFGKRKFQHLVEARVEAISQVRRARPDWTLRRLAMFFERDHTTVIHALRKTGDHA